MGNCLKNTLKKVEASKMLFKRFSNNYMVKNAGQCHLLTSTSEEASVNPLSANFTKWSDTLQ